MNHGKLIVIEGLDGSGKETQTAELAGHLRQDGLSLLQLSYPRYDKDSSAMVRHYLAGDFGKNPSDVSPYIASTFYAADRYASYKEEMEEFLTKGGIVLADRYTTSNMIHQAGKLDDPVERKNFLDWLVQYEFELLGLPVPDKVFFLDIPPAISAKLIAERKNKITGEMTKDIHEADEGYLNQAYKNAISLVEQYGWERINCVQNNRLKSIDEIHAEIYAKTKECLHV